MPEQRAAGQLQTVKQFHNNPRLLSWYRNQRSQAYRYSQSQAGRSAKPAAGKSRIGHHA
jgi:hypothetical protein